MTAPWKDVACPACAAQPGELCFDPLTLHPRVELPTPHYDRVDAAAFIDTLGQPPGDRAQITDAEILATGEV